MANKCNNLLLVRGDLADLEAFIKQARPTREAARRELGRSLDSVHDESEREWQIRLYTRSQPLELSAFGTPLLETDDGVWNAEFEEAPLVAFRAGAASDLSAEEEILLYSFRTPWSPPLAALRAMAEQHPLLAFVLRYAEPGGQFAGELRYQGGILLTDEELEVEDVLVEHTFTRGPSDPGVFEPRIYANGRAAINGPAAIPEAEGRRSVHGG